MHGLKFRRQHPFGDSVLDFVCLERKLVIEVDGGQHSEQAAADIDRTRSLEQAGFRVLRFWNDDILKKLDEVGEKTWATLDEPHPHRARGGRSRFRRPWPMDATPERDAARRATAS
jgi:lysyl-tRNA synthetase class 2